MNKYSILTLFSLSALLFGCQVDEAIYQNESKDSELMVSASFGSESNSRTTLDGVNIYWNENDALSIFLGNGNNKKFTIMDGVGTNNATFIGSGDIIITGGTVDQSVVWTNVAYYPFSENLSISKKGSEYTVNTTFQEVQQFAGSGNFGQDSYPLIAVAQNHLQTSFSFKHIGSILKLRLKGTATISEIRLKSEQYMLAGSCSITAAYGTSPVLNIENGTSVILMDCGENGVKLNEDKETEFAFAVPPMSIKADDLSFTIYDTDGKCMSYTYPKDYELKQGASGLLPIQNYVGRELQAIEYPVQMNAEGYNTIEEAVNDITDGAAENTITLASGEYTLPEIKNKSICFMPKEGELVKINTSVTAHNDTKYEGSSLSFKNLTMVGTSYSGKDNGYVQAKSEKYEGCTFLNYFMFAGDEVTVNNCDFKTEVEQYFWTGSSSSISFTDCNFTGVNRAVKVLSIGNGQTETRIVKFTRCHFDAAQTEKAVLELDGTSANSPYSVTIDNCTKSETFTAWFNDKDVTAGKYVVTVDGVKVWPDYGYEEISAGVYNVWSAKGLLHFSDVQQKGVTLNITDDIDFEGAEFKAIPAGYNASLTINGNGHTISNVKVVSGTNDNTTGQASMFYAYTGSTLNVSDLKIDNIQVTADENGSGYAAAVVGYAEGVVTLDDVDVTDATITGAKSSGMLVGHLTTTGSLVAKNCNVNGTVTLTDYENGGHYAGEYIGTVQQSAELTTCTANVELNGNLKSTNVGTLCGRIVSPQGSLMVDGVQIVTTKDGLQAALNNATTDITLALYADITDNVTITQKEGVDVVIDGKEKTFTGVMTTFGNGRQSGAETLTIKNINFVAATGASSCIVSPDRTVNNAYSYSHNVTVENCTFTDPDGTVNCAAVRHEDGGDKNWKVVGCTVQNTMHSILQVNNVEGKLTIDNCEVYSKNGANLNSCTNVEMTECNFDVKGYAVRFGVKSGGNLGTAKTYLIKNSTLKSACDGGDAVVMFRASAVDATLTFENSTLEGTNKISGNTDDTEINGTY